MVKRGVCGDCHWWDAEHEAIKTVPLLVGQTDLGFCRKHRPIVMQFEGKFHGFWGAVDKDEGCAEYRDKVES